jgi:hypothetical protein
MFNFNLDSIISSINKLIDKLEAHAEVLIEKENNARIAAEDHLDLAVQHLEERIKASRIADKVRELIS